MRIMVAPAWCIPSAQAVEAVKAAKQKSKDAGLAVDLDLLLGRVFSQWKGHNGEALALYDSLAEVCTLAAGAVCFLH